MNEKLKTVLNIEETAVELIAMINFLFYTPDDIDKFFNDCDGKNGKEINKYVYNKRRQAIMSSKFMDLKEFYAMCKDNFKKALERLFQEPINEAKLAHLDTSDPIHIWKIHREQKADVRFMEFVLYI